MSSSSSIIGASTIIVSIFLDRIFTVLPIGLSYSIGGLALIFLIYGFVLKYEESNAKRNNDKSSAEMNNRDKSTGYKVKGNKNDISNNLAMGHDVGFDVYGDENKIKNNTSFAPFGPPPKDAIQQYSALGNVRRGSFANNIFWGFDNIVDTDNAEGLVIRNNLSVAPERRHPNKLTLNFDELGLPQYDLARIGTILAVLKERLDSRNADKNYVIRSYIKIGKIVRTYLKITC